MCPSWCGSVDGALAREPKGRCRFDSQSGHKPGLWARSLVCGECEKQPHIDVSLPLFLPPFLSLSK